MKTLYQQVRDLFAYYGEEYMDVRARGYAIPPAYASPPKDAHRHRRRVLVLGLYPDQHTWATMIPGRQRIYAEYYSPFANLAIKSNRNNAQRFIARAIERQVFSAADVAYANLFQIRLRDHRDLHRRTDPEWRQFLEAQLAITDRYIKEVVQPSIVVVVHPVALNYMGLYFTNRQRPCWMGYQEGGVDQVFGMHRIFQGEGACLDIGERPFPHPMLCIERPITDSIGIRSHSPLEWLIHRALRLLDLFGQQDFLASPHYQLLHSLEVDLPAMRQSRRTPANDPGWGLNYLDRMQELWRGSEKSGE